MGRFVPSISDKPKVVLLSGKIVLTGPKVCLFLFFVFYTSQPLCAHVCARTTDVNRPRAAVCVVLCDPLMLTAVAPIQVREEIYTAFNTVSAAQIKAYAIRRTGVERSARMPSSCDYFIALYFFSFPCYVLAAASPSLGIQL
jgi:hypothetical protein